MSEIESRAVCDAVVGKGTQYQLSVVYPSQNHVLSSGGYVFQRPKLLVCDPESRQIESCKPAGMSVH